MDYNNGYNGNNGYGYPPPPNRNGGYGYPPNNQGQNFNYQYDPNFYEKQNQKKNISKISIAVGLAVVGFTALSYIVALIAKQIPGFYSAYQNNVEFASWFEMIYSVLIIGIPFLCAFLFLKAKKIMPQSLPLGTPRNTSVFFLLVFAGLMACLAGSYLSSGFSNIVESVFGITFTMPDDDTKLTSISVIIPYIVKSAVVPAFIEEFSVRGVVMQPLRKYGDKFAILMSALVFALMHGNMVQIPFAFIAGIAIGYAVIVTGSMWTGVIIHFLNNFASIAMQIAYDNCTEAVAGAITLAIVVTLMLVGIICAVIYMKDYAHGCKISEGESKLLSSGEKSKAFIVTAPMILAMCILLYETATYIEF